jgi:hypothetical protein
MAIDAILKSIVATRTFCDLNSSKTAIASSSNGKTGAEAKPWRISINRLYSKLYLLRKPTPRHKQSESVREYVSGDNDYLLRNREPL